MNIKQKDSPEFTDVDNETAYALFDSLFMSHYIDERKKHATSQIELADIPQLSLSLSELPGMIR